MTLENLDNTDSPKHIIFKKNEDWFRCIDKMPDPDFGALIKNPEDNKERGVILIGVVWHIWHTSARILEALNSHSDFKWNIVIVSPANQMPSQVDLSMAWFAEHLHQNLVLEITRIQSDIQEIFIDREPKPHHDKYTQNFHKYHKPNTKKPLTKKPYTKKIKKK